MPAPLKVNEAKLKFIRCRTRGNWYPLPFLFFGVYSSSSLGMKAGEEYSVDWGRECNELIFYRVHKSGLFNVKAQKAEVQRFADGSYGKPVSHRLPLLQLARFLGIDCIPSVNSLLPITKHCEGFAVGLEPEFAGDEYKGEIDLPKFSRDTRIAFRSGGKYGEARVTGSMKAGVVAASGVTGMSISEIVEKALVEYLPSLGIVVSEDFYGRNHKEHSALRARMKEK